MNRRTRRQLSTDKGFVLCLWTLNFSIRNAQSRWTMHVWKDKFEMKGAVKNATLTKSHSDSAMNH